MNYTFYIIENDVLMNGYFRILLSARVTTRQFLNEVKKRADLLYR